MHESTLNVNGARDARKRANLFELMKLKKVDKMFVQVTHGDTVNEADWEKEWEGEVTLSHLRRTSGGVGLWRKDFFPGSYVVEEKVKGRLMIESLNVVFVNVYSPNTGPVRVQFYMTSVRLEVWN